MAEGVWNLPSPFPQLWRVPSCYSGLLWPDRKRIVTWHVLSCTVLGSLTGVILLKTQDNPLRLISFYLHFTNEATETQKSAELLKVTCLVHQEFDSGQNETGMPISCYKEISFACQIQGVAPGLLKVFSFTSDWLQLEWGRTFSLIRNQNLLHSTRNLIIFRSFL